MINFDTIFNKYFRILLIAGLKEKLRQEDAEDAVAHTFIVYWRNRNNIPMSNIQSYLNICLNNKIKDIKKSKNNSAVWYTYNMDYGLIFDESFREKENLVQLLYAAINKLNQHPRRVLQLYLQGYETGQIAMLLGKSNITIRNQKSEAIKVLRQYLMPHI